MSIKNTIIILAATSIIFIAIGFLLTNRESAEKMRVESEIRQMESQSSSDEVGAIEKDLDDTDLSDLDRELQDIEAELNLSY